MADGSEGGDWVEGACGPVIRLDSCDHRHSHDQTHKAGRRRRVSAGSFF